MEPVKLYLYPCGAPLHCKKVEWIKGYMDGFYRKGRMPDRDHDKAEYEKGYDAGVKARSTSNCKSAQ